MAHAIKNGIVLYPVRKPCPLDGDGIPTNLETKSGNTSPEFSNGVYKNGDFITRLLEQEITLPDREWMKKWFEHWIGFYRMGLRDIRRNKGWHKRFCQKRCTCEVGDYLARATVNFAILFSELHGFVPTTKDKVLKGFRKFGKKNLIPGLRVALRISRQDRPLSRKEAETVYPTVRWLRDTLARRLRV